MLKRLLNRQKPSTPAAVRGPSEAPAIDAEFYRHTYRSVPGADDPEIHYFSEGARRGFLPSETFDPLAYAFTMSGVPPEHALAHARLVSGMHATDLGEIAATLPPGILPERAAGLGAGVVLHEKDPDNVGRNRAAARSFGKPFSLRLDNGAERDGPAYHMEAPAPEEVWAALRSDRPLTVVKLPHGLWDIHVALQRIADRLEALPGTALFTREQTERLARRLLGATTHKRGSFVLTSDYFIDDVFAAMANLPEDPDLLVGLAYSGYPVASGVAEHARDLFERGDIRARLLRDAFPAGRRFVDGTLFKRWAISGDLSRLPSALAGRPVVFILSEMFDGLGPDLGLEDSHRVEIPAMGSHALRHDIVERASALLDELAGRPRPPVVIAQVGGSLTFWLLMELRKRHPKAALLDVGQSICIWRLAESRKLGWLRTYFDEVVENNDLAAFYGTARVAELREMIEPFEGAPAPGDFPA